MRGVCWGMATPTSIAAYFAQASAQGLSPQSLYDGLMYAMAAGLSDDGRVVIERSKDGMALRTMSWDEATLALGRLKQLIAIDGGIVVTGPGFLPQCSGRGYW